VFAGGDGLDPYRRLLRQSERRLRHGGVVLQLDGGVVAAAREELATVRAVLASPTAR
jgi:hypothetical protein